MKERKKREKKNCTFKEFSKVKAIRKPERALLKLPQQK